MPRVTEYDLQRAFCGWLDGWPKNGVPTKPPALAPGVTYWHTPNGGTRRDAFEGKRLKDIGLKPGVHDLLFLRPTQFECGVFGLLFGMEWKAPGGTLSDAQRDMHPRMIASGLADSIVVDDLQAAKDFCFKHMLTVRVK